MAQINQGYQLVTQLDYNDDLEAPNLTDPLGIEWVDLDPTLGLRKFRFVSNTGANSSNLVSGDVVVYTDNYKRVVSSTISDGSRNCPLGVAQDDLTEGNQGWVQTYGYHSGVRVLVDTYAFGSTIIMSATDKCGDLEATGTAPTYPVLGRALAAQTGSDPYYVAAQLHVGMLA